MTHLIIKMINAWTTLIIPQEMLLAESAMTLSTNNVIWFSMKAKKEWSTVLMKTITSRTLSSKHKISIVLKIKFKINSNLTPLKISNQSFSDIPNSKAQLSHRTLNMNNIRTIQKPQRKKNLNKKRNPKLIFLKNGKKKLSPFWKKETFINSQLSTTETWPSFSFVCFQNIWNPMLINKFSLPKL